VGVSRISIEGKLKHFRSWNTELVAQCANVRRDHPEILGDEWEKTQFLLDSSEKLGTWAWCPAPYPGRFGLGGYVPCSRECTEMVQANHVHLS
jgi:hypothetical protein